MRRTASATRARLMRLFLCLSLLAQCWPHTLADATSRGAGMSASAAGKVSTPQGVRAAHLPDLDEARHRLRREPKAVPPVPSTRRRCPPRNPRCNDGADGPATPTPTPTPRPGRGRTSLEVEPEVSLAALAGRPLPSPVSAALNGGRPVASPDALDYYRGEGGYGLSDAPHARLFPPLRYGYGAGEPLRAFGTLFPQLIGAGETLWVDDSVPAGATPAGDGEGWNWVGVNPAPYSGSASHQSNVVGGMHQHFFYNASSTLAVGAGERLFAYVYLDPANVPSEVMLQWNSNQESWNHRAYWGANQIGWGTDATGSRRHMGALPVAGGWVRLEVPASLVGLEGKSLNGMAFTLSGGRAWWDRAGKVSAAYTGTPLTVPGNVEAEQFDNGGPGVGYFDTTPGSHGSDFTQPAPYPVPSFRQPTDVDINGAADYSGGYLVVMQAGDWMNYTVDVAASATYTLDARTFYWNALGGTFHVEIDGVNKTGALQMPGGSRWEIVSKAGVQLTAGRHVMRVVADANAGGDVYLGAIDYVRLLPPEARPGTGLTGEYYDGDALQTHRLTRADAAVNFDWGAGSPDPSLGSDFFSVRWTGTVAPRYTENYTFYTSTDDGVRLWIDGQLVIDRWQDQAPTEWSGSIALEANRQYAVRMEFFEHWGGATARLSWSSASQTKEVVPQSRLYGCWKGTDQFADELFRAAVVRRPSTTELQDWTARLGNAQGDSQLLAEARALGAQVFNSAEYAARNRTDQEYVSDLFRAYLQRAPDAGGLNWWTNEIAPCGTDQQCRQAKRADVRVAFDQSGEFTEKVRNLCGTSAAAPVNVGAGYNFTTARLDPVNRTGGGGVDAYSRNYNFQLPLVSLAGRAGLDLGLTLSYNSLVWTQDSTGVTFDADQGFPSPGFRLGFPVVEPKFVNPLIQQEGQPTRSSYLLVTPGGMRVELRQTTPGVYESADSSYLRLVEGGGHPQTLLAPDGTQLSFILLDGSYRCHEVKDRNGNFLSVAYYGDGRIDRVTDTLGRVVTFNYDNFQHLLSITQPWRRETEANPAPAQDEGHAWATFGYTNVTLQPAFSNLAVVGEQPGTVIPALAQVGLPDGSFYRFKYNQWGQVWQVTHYAADSVGVNGRPNESHPLTSTRLDLPGSDLRAASPQTDCPRFKELRVWVEHGVRDQNSEVATSYGEWSPGMASCTITPPDPTPGTDVSDDVTVTELYETALWKKGLTRQSEVRAGGQLKQWTTFDWEHDGTAGAQYPTNQRVRDTVVNAVNGAAVNKRRTAVSYTTFGLPREVKEYDADAATVLRTTVTDYGLLGLSQYASRRLVALPTFRYVYEGVVSQANLRSKVGYVYDDPELPGYLLPLPQNAKASQHDATNFGATFRWRGNVSRTRRYDVQDSAGGYVESVAGYNVTGTVAFAEDAEHHRTLFDYADAFFQNVNRNAPALGLKTFAYQTTVTDPDGFTSSFWYNYDMAVVTKTETPQPDVPDDRPGPEVTRLYDAAGRVLKVTNSVNGAHTETVYDPSMTLVKTYTTVAEESLQNLNLRLYGATALDGLGRTRGTARDFPGSTGPTPAGSYSAQVTHYDEAGRVVFQSNPTEVRIVSGNWVPAGDDANGGLWRGATQEHDWKGRLKKAVNADGTYRLSEYGGCSCAGGEVVTQTDEAGRRQRATSDALGRVWKTEALNADGSVYWTRTNTYNARDQVTNTSQQTGASGEAQEVVTTYDGHGRLSARRAPVQTAATTYDYYDDDRVKTLTDARGATAAYVYNGRGLLKAVTYGGSSPAPPPLTFSYDAAGNRKQMNDEAGAVTYSYDGLSRLTNETRQFNGLSAGRSLGYGYTLAGQLEHVVDYTGARVTYNYDTAGQLLDATGSGPNSAQTYAGGFKYRAWGAVKDFDFGNGVHERLGYNARLQNVGLALSNLETASTPGGTLEWGFDYHADGRLWHSTDVKAPHFDRSYEYDQVGRLTEARTGSEARGGTAADGPYRQSYAYDVWENVRLETSRTWAQNTETLAADYTNNRRQGWSYDQDGRVTYNGDSSFAYDAAGRQSSYIANVGVEVSSNGMTAPALEVTRAFDGEAAPVKTVTTRRWVDTANGTPQYRNSLETVYYLRSTVLGGKVVAELDTAGNKVTGYIYVGGMRVARQYNVAVSGSTVVWESTNPATGTEVTLPANRAASRTELDPLGADVTSPPAAAEVEPPPFYNPKFDTMDRDYSWGPSEMSQQAMAEYEGMVRDTSDMASARAAWQRGDRSLAQTILERNPNVGIELTQGGQTATLWGADAARALGLVPTQGKVGKGGVPERRLTGSEVRALALGLLDMLSDQTCHDFIREVLSEAEAQTGVASRGLMDSFFEVAAQPKGGIFMSGDLSGDGTPNSATIAGGLASGGIEYGTAKILIIPVFDRVGFKGQNAVEFQNYARRTMLGNVLHETMHQAGAGYHDVTLARALNAIRVRKGLEGAREFPLKGKTSTMDMVNASNYWGAELMSACKPK